MKQYSSPPSAVMSVRARRAMFESNNAQQNNPSELAKLGQQQQPSASHGNSNSSNSSSSSGAIDTATRKPFCFLSPNKTSSNNKTPSKQRQETAAARLKHEISNLQQRIKIFDSDADVAKIQQIESSEELVLEKDLNEEHLEELNRKLLVIQNGLGQIEEERLALVHRAQTLEKEKSSLRTQLTHREKEIEVLRKRCLSDTQKLKDCAHLRAANNELNDRVIGLQCEVDYLKDGERRMLELQHELEECELQKANLTQRLEEVTRDHNAVCENLVKCLENNENLTQEKQTLEDERRRLRQTSNLDVDRKRLEQIQVVSGLKEDLKSRDDKVQQLDKLLQEKIATIQKLRTELSSLEASQSETIQHLADEYDRQLRDINQSYEREMADFRSKLAQKNAEIEALRNDMSVQMQELMKATADLQELQEDSKMLNSLMEDVEALEQDRSNLRETLHERDTEIAELSAEILKLEIEKELAEQDAQKLELLQTKLAATEDERESTSFATAQRLEEQLRQLKSAQKMRIDSIRSEYDAAICDMQSKLERAESAASNQSAIHAQAMAAKDKVIATLQEQLNKARKETHLSSETQQTELSTLREELQHANEKLATKEAELQGQRLAELSDKEATIHSLQCEMDHLKSELQTAKVASSTKIESLTEEVTIWKEKSSSVESMVSGRAVEYEADVKRLTAKVDILERENQASQITIKEQSSQLDHAQVSIRRYETKASEDEEHLSQLEATASDLQKKNEAILLTHDTEIETLKQTIAELEHGNNRARDAMVQQERLLLETDAKMKSKQAAFDTEIAILERDLEKHKTHIKKLEVTASHAEECEIEAAKLKQSLSSMKLEHNLLKTGFVEAEKKLAEEKSFSASLSNKLESLQVSEGALQKECCLLRLNYEEAQSELEKTMAYRNDIATRKSQQEEALEADLAAAEEKLLSQEQQMIKFEAELQDRTNLLAEMVAHSKKLQEKLDQTNSVFASMEERSSVLQVQLQDREEELKQRHEEWRQKEDEYLGEIQNMQHMRAVCESDLAQLQLRYEKLHCERKDASELEKENQQLKDKVRRQEAYLKRKLEQDKAARERNGAGAGRIPGSAMKTPARSVKASSRKTASSAVLASRATRSTAQETNVDWELEQLLAD